jgi:hypothetical protein
MIMALALGQQSRVATVMRYLDIESPGGCWVMTVDSLAGDCYRSSWARERSKYIIEVMIRYGFAIYLRSACMDDEEKAGKRECGKYAILA